MPDGAINHYNLVRLRVRGEGNLRVIMSAEDDLPQTEFLAIPMTATTGRLRDRLINFQAQYASLTLKTSDFGDYFRIDRIVIFAKGLWNEYPG